MRAAIFFIITLPFSVAAEETECTEVCTMSLEQLQEEMAGHGCAAYLHEDWNDLPSEKHVPVVTGNYVKTGVFDEDGIIFDEYVIIVEPQLLSGHVTIEDGYLLYHGVPSHPFDVEIGMANEICLEQLENEAMM